MVEKFQAFQQTDTWDIVPRPANVQPVSCKWIFKVKHRPDGSIERHKSRVVAREFTQEHEIDYDENFAPIAQMTTVRTLLTVAAVQYWPLYQMDMKNAFLHGSLTEDVNMQPLSGLTTPLGHACHLHRAIYGLKQAPRTWFEYFWQTLTSFGF